MKLTISGTLKAAAVLLLTARAGIAGVLSGSAHDFSKAGWNSSQKVCVLCHTPQPSDLPVPGGPLWNRTEAITTYALYAGRALQLATLQLEGNSKLCLSCHDGTVAVDSFGGTTGAIGNAAHKARGNIGAVLTNDHPIGIAYNAALLSRNPALFNPDTTYVTIGSNPTKTGTITSTMLYSGQVECASCHDVHNTFAVGANGTGMVKMAVVGSAICMACHIS